MNNEKIFLTYEEQINLLRDKKLIIKSKSKAIKMLQEIGYYKLINAYKHSFMNQVKNSKGEVIDSQYMEDVSIEDLYQLYKFDTSLKSAVFEASTVAETMLKSHISYLISKKYGIKEDDYLKEENYVSRNTADNQKYIRVIKCIRDEIAKQITCHPAMIWYKENYGFYPFWVVVNIMTFGSVSKFFSIMKDEDRIEISKRYGVQPKTLESFIRYLCGVRNVCAHNDVLYKFKAKNAIVQNDIKKIYKELGIEINKITGNYYYGSKDFFAVIIALKFLIDKKSFNDLITRIKGLLEVFSKKVKKNIYDLIKLQMGLVNNWDKIGKISL